MKYLLLFFLIACTPEKIPVIGGKAESCLLCHGDTKGLMGGHDPKIIGCSSCHLGNPNERDKTLSHQKMKLVPGNLSDAPLTCGTSSCHQEITKRVNDSLMGTARGMIAVNRYVFGEQKSPDGEATVHDLKETDADTHLKSLCIMCHLGHEKIKPEPPNDLSRGGGCTACHISYTKKGEHPSLTQKIKNENCFGCHSRSSRISLSYEGWFESDSGGTRTLLDGRTLQFKSADVHHEKGLLCIDCHTSRETMGDGKKHLHQENQVEISCEDCHQTAPQVGTWDDLSGEDRSLIFRRHGKTLVDRKFVKIKKSGEFYTNVFLEDGKIKLEEKNSLKTHELSPLISACKKDEHKRLACTACHTAWTPQCIGCHTQKEKDGRWSEYGGTFIARAPTLGVKGDKIVPFTPGMILTINKRGSESDDLKRLEKDGEFHRIFAAVSPHTITKNVRGCKECHLDSNTLGFGTNQYEILRDGLPADAWIYKDGTRKKESGLSVTRKDARPFNKKEIEKILKAKLTQ